MYRKLSFVRGLASRLAAAALPTYVAATWCTTEVRADESDYAAAAAQLKAPSWRGVERPRPIHKTPISQSTATVGKAVTPAVANLSVTHGSSEGVSTADAMYQLRLEKGLGARFVCRSEDVDAIAKEVCVVLNCRGTPFVVAKAWMDMFEAAAKQDSQGYTWYIISDATPEPICDSFSSKTRIPVADASFDTTEITQPTIWMLNKISETHNKYVMPLPKEANTAAIAGVSEAHAPYLATLPQCNELYAWLSDAWNGKQARTLVGEPRDSVESVFPFVTPVVSDTFNEIVLDPTHDVLLEAYLTDCPMCMALGARVRMLGYLAQKYFPHIRVAIMNVDYNERPREWMPGPAFPTLQLFNSGNGEYTKIHGPACGAARSGVSPMHDVAVPHGVRALDCAESGTPACIPSVSFAHPVNAGKMAMPTVAEMVYWLARYSSMPFNPAEIPVDEPKCDNLLHLCEEMEREAMVIEQSVFQLFYFMSLENEYKAVATTPQRQQWLSDLQRLIENAKRVVVERGMYGALPDIENALDTLDYFVEGHGMLRDVRQYLKDKTEINAENEAMKLVKQLL